MLLLLMTYCLPTYANEQEIVNGFQTFVLNLVTPIEATYGKGYYNILGDDGTYFKAHKVNFKYECDIKKSDSVMFPYFGILEISNDINYSNYYKTKKEAERALDVKFTTHDIKRLIYKYNNGEWIEDKAYFYSSGHWHRAVNFSIGEFKCYND